MNTRVSIDPGKDGAISTQVEGEKAEAFAMPDTIAGIVEILENLENPFATVEKVHSMPKQGVVSTFSFGVNYGSILGALAALKIPHRLETPQKWQKRIAGLPSTSIEKINTKGMSKQDNENELKRRKKAKDKKKRERKNAIKAYSARMYPHIKVTLKTADALAMLSVMEPPQA